jgi:hypothetical protein
MKKATLIAGKDGSLRDYKPCSWDAACGTIMKNGFRLILN